MLRASYGGSLDKFDRIYALHGILSRARHPVTRETIEQQLECSRATFGRIVDTMRDHLGAPICYSKERNGWYYDTTQQSSYELPGLWFNAHELNALLAINKLMQDLQPGLLGDQLQPVQKRIEKLLTTQHLGSGELPQRVRIIAIGIRDGGQSFQPVAEAVLQRKQINIHYHARSHDQNSQRTVSPQRLVHYRNNWYLDAWCHQRQALRSFSIDRVKHPKLLNDTAINIDEPTLNEHYADAYGIFAGKAEQTAVLKFTPRAARWVSEERWHPKQQGEFLPSGHYQLKLPYSNPKELIMDILKYGPGVEVIAPDTLRENVAEQLKQTINHYSKDKK